MKFCILTQSINKDFFLYYISSNHIPNDFELNWFLIEYGHSTNRDENVSNETIINVFELNDEQLLIL